MDIKTIAFCFPYHEVSGVPVLFSNLADYFSKNYPLKVFIVDFADGYMATRLNKNKRINNIVLETGKSVLIDTDVLVMQAILPYAMRPEIKIAKSTKILFWNLHPKNLIPNIYPWRLFYDSSHTVYKDVVSVMWKRKYDLMKTFIKKAVEKESLVFMDSSNLSMTSDFYSVDLLTDSFVPITCSSGKYRGDIVNSNNVINFAWIGRLCDFKIHILNYLILRLSQSAVELKQKMVLYIIGDGPEEDNLIYMEYLNEYFSLKKMGSLSKAKMDKFLYTKIDINASMGTSILESAKFGIPSIVLDFDYKPINKNYKFRWLHETKDFDVGHLIKDSGFHGNDYLLTEMVREFLTNREQLSSKSYKYYEFNHSLKAISFKLFNQVQKAHLTMPDIHPFLLRKGLLRRLHERKLYGI